MAKFYAGAAMDMRNLSFEDIFDGWYASGLSLGMQNPTTLHGVSYADHAHFNAGNTATAASYDSFELLFTSTGNLQVPEFPENPFTTPAVTGTVNGLAYTFNPGLKGESVIERWAMTGVSLNPNDILGAAKTDGNTDDLTLIGGALGGNDVIYLSSSSDYGVGYNGNDTMSGNGGADTIYGGAGTDKIYGGSSGDIIYVGSSADYIQGGTSADRLYGGSSGDDFIFNDGETGKGTARDVIYDFVKASDDLDLRLIDANTKKSGDQAFAFNGTTADNNEVWYKKSGSTVIVYGDNTGDGKADFEIELRGVSSLTAADFLL